MLVLGIPLVVLVTSDRLVEVFAYDVAVGDGTRSRRSSDLPSGGNTAFDLQTSTSSARSALGARLPRSVAT